MSDNSTIQHAASTSIIKHSLSQLDKCLICAWCVLDERSLSQLHRVNGAKISDNITCKGVLWADSCVKPTTSLK